MNRLAWACIIVASALLLFAMQPGPAVSAERCGVASFYSTAHHGKAMANGRPFNMYAMTAAMWGPKLGTRYRVTLGSKSVVVKITDRGPAKRLNRVIDLSYAAAKKLGMIERGVATVCLTRLS
jgi:rare lipoprotein A